MTAQFGMFHCIIITNKTTEICNVLTKSWTFFLINGEDVQFLMPDITLTTTLWQFIDFCEDCGLPGVVGAIDGTHVYIIVNEETYQ